MIQKTNVLFNFKFYYTNCEQKFNKTLILVFVVYYI